MEVEEASDRDECIIEGRDRNSEGGKEGKKWWQENESLTDLMEEQKSLSTVSASFL